MPTDEQPGSAPTARPAPPIVGAAESAADLGVLREPTRRAIVGLLAERPRRAAALASALDVSPASMSRHLRVLRLNGIVRDSRVARDGRARLYTIDPLRARQVMAWLAVAEAVIDEPTATVAAVPAAPGPPEPRSLPPGRSQVVALEVGPFRLAIATDRVRRIVPDEPASAVPYAPVGVIGIVDHDGQVVPVVDVRTRLGVPGPRPEDARLVVVGLDSGPVALRVDATTDIGTIDGQSVRPMPGAARSGGDDPVIGVIVLAGRLATLVDPEALAAFASTAD